VLLGLGVSQTLYPFAAPPVPDVAGQRSDARPVSSDRAGVAILSYR
jgi:hypothetical protein